MNNFCFQERQDLAEIGENRAYLAAGESLDLPVRQDHLDQVVHVGSLVLQVLLVNEAHLENLVLQDHKDPEDYPALLVQPVNQVCLVGANVVNLACLALLASLVLLGNLAVQVPVDHRVLEENLGLLVYLEQLAQLGYLAQQGSLAHLVRLDQEVNLDLPGHLDPGVNQDYQGLLVELAQLALKGHKDHEERKGQWEIKVQEVNLGLQELRETEVNLVFQVSQAQLDLEGHRVYQVPAVHLDHVVNPDSLELQVNYLLILY